MDMPIVHKGDLVIYEIGDEEYHIRQAEREVVMEFEGKMSSAFWRKLIESGWSGVDMDGDGLMW